MDSEGTTIQSRVITIRGAEVVICIREERTYETGRLEAFVYGTECRSRIEGKQNQKIPIKLVVHGQYIHNVRTERHKVFASEYRGFRRHVALDRILHARVLALYAWLHQRGVAEN